MVVYINCRWRHPQWLKLEASNRRDGPHGIPQAHPDRSLCTHDLHCYGVLLESRCSQANILSQHIRSLHENQVSDWSRENVCMTFLFIYLYFFLVLLKKILQIIQFSFQFHPQFHIKIISQYFLFFFNPPTIGRFFTIENWIFTRSASVINLSLNCLSLWSELEQKRERHWLKFM